MPTHDCAPPAGTRRGANDEQRERLEHHCTDAATLAHALDGKASGEGYMACCPAHDDRNPSLSIKDGDNGRPLIHCHAGCEQDAVIDALRDRGLWPERSTDTGIRHPSLGEPHTVWTYRDAEGRTLGHVCRWETAKGKDIRPFVGGRWQHFKKPRPLYGLDRLARNPDAPVIVVEGEKATDAAQRIFGEDYVVVTWPGGTGSVNTADWTKLQGRDVILWPDADDAGQKAMNTIAKNLYGIASSVRPADVSALPEKADAADVDERTAARLVAEAKPIEAAKTRPTFRLVRVSDMELTPPRWLIRGLLEADTLALVFGDPGSLKSFLAIDWSCRIAACLDFHGHKVEQGPVAYIAGEGHNGLLRRFKAWAIRNQVSLDSLPLYASTMPAALCDETRALEAANAVNEIAERHGQSPALVVVDTVARNFGPGDENSTQDMGAFIQAADMIRSKHGATVLLVHHTGHAEKSRARGAMALKGALDAEYRLDKDELGVVRMEATKMKDAVEPEPLAFKPATVELGITDDEGQPVTSAVLDLIDYAPPPKNGKQGRGKWQAVALERLHELQRQHRANVENDGRNPDTARVSLDDWRDACIGAGMRRQHWYTVKDALADQGMVQIEMGFVRPLLSGGGGTDGS